MLAVSACGWCFVYLCRSVEPSTTPRPLSPVYRTGAFTAADVRCDALRAFLASHAGYTINNVVMDGWPNVRCVLPTFKPRGEGAADSETWPPPEAEVANVVELTSAAREGESRRMFVSADPLEAARIDVDALFKNGRRVYSCNYCGEALERVRVCNGCLVVAYCGEAHRKADWNEGHKDACTNWESLVE